MTASTAQVAGSLLETAVRRCAETQDSSGGWAVPPDPRVLETALACHALAMLPPDARGHGAVEAALARAKRWLVTAAVQEHHPLAALLEGALRDVALDSGAVIDLGPVRSSSAAAPRGKSGQDLTHPGFTDLVYSSRVLLMHAVALHAGRPVKGAAGAGQLRATVAARYEAHRGQRLKPWSAVELSAARVLIEGHFGGGSAVTEAVTRIEAQQDGDGSFFQNPISTSMALLALGAAGAAGPALRRCRDWLLDHQSEDGTWRFCTCDIWDTTLVIRAFGRHRIFREQSLPGALEFLAATQNDDGGWGFGGFAQSDCDTTGAALLALPAGYEDDKQISRAVDYLARQQMEDGLWRTWQFDKDPPAQDTVAHVVAALSRFPDHHDRPLRPARLWLTAQNRSSSGWRASWYHSAPYALLEVGRALGYRHPRVRHAAEALAAAQNRDGGWGRVPGEESCASATGLALAALTRCESRDGHALAAAVSYLGRTRREDGTWQGTPEMFGPRPLLTHMPVETQAFTAMGLTSMSLRDSPAAQRDGIL